MVKKNILKKRDINLKKKSIQMRMCIYYIHS